MGIVKGIPGFQNVISTRELLRDFLSPSPMGAGPFSFSVRLQRQTRPGVFYLFVVGVSFFCLLSFLDFFLLIVIHVLFIERLLAQPQGVLRGRRLVGTWKPLPSIQVARRPQMVLVDSASLPGSTLQGLFPFVNQLRQWELIFEQKRRLLKLCSQR